MTQSVTAAELRDAGLSRSFADHVLAGTRQVGVPLALWLLDRRGLRVGPVAGRTPAEIRLLRSMYEAKAPASVLRRAASTDAARTDVAA